MQEAARVEIVPLMVPIDEQTFQVRQDVVDRLAGLGQIDPSTGEIPGVMRRGWVARIGGAEFPVVTYSVEPAAEGGAALVSLLIPADEVSIGGHRDTVSPVAAPPQMRPATPEQKPAVSTWGAKTTDPRASIPGWMPESLGEQVAGNAVGRLA